MGLGELCLHETTDRVRIPIEGGEELQIPAGDQQLRVIVHQAGQAPEEQPLLAVLTAIEGNAFCVLPHAHQPVPARPSCYLTSFVAD